MKRNLSVIILAAGKGKRMKSSTSKVLHSICGRPILSYSIDLSIKLKAKQIILVLGRKKQQICDYLDKHYKNIKVGVVTQHKVRGTADAVLSARSKIKKEVSDLLILYADQPLLNINTVKRLWGQHLKSGADCTLLTSKLNQPSGYGRIIRGKGGQIVKICEDKDLNKEESLLREVNAGSCIFKRHSLFGIIKKIKPDNKKKEYYLTEAVALLKPPVGKISSVTARETSEVLGINSRYDLIKLDDLLRKDIMDRFISKGVTISSPDTTFINSGVRIGKDTIIKPFVYIDSDVRIGKRCAIGPFCHIRGGTVISDDAVVGSFAELNRSSVGKGSRIKHFSYLGDAFLGKYVNIGAGTVTANFDGKNKYKTQIKDGAFIGSDTVLVAPVKVGKSAVTGAGCVVTKRKHVPDRAIVCGVPAKRCKRKEKWIK